MSECPDTDAIATIGSALRWNVQEGLRHLQTCDDCRDRIDVLQATHAAFTVVEAIDDAVLARIPAALSAEARSERTRTRTIRRRAAVAEALLAGAAAPIALITSGVAIGSAAAGILAVVTGIVLMTLGSRFRVIA
jgi:hypothetical protein